MSRILITGATGNVGSQVASQLAATGAEVRALVRNPDAVRLPARIEPVRGDLTLPDTLDACLEGVSTVFLVWTAPPAAVDAAMEQIAGKADRIVFLSAPLKTPHPFFQQPNPLRTLAEKIERLIESSGMQWTFLRPGMLATNSLLWWAPQVRAGKTIRWPYLDVPTAPIDERDLAAIAVRALLERGHEGAEYVLTGPEPLTQSEQLAAIGRAIGRPIAVEEISPEEARQELLAIMPAGAINMLLAAWGAGAGQHAHVTSTFQAITGSPPRTFFDWARDHAAEFQPS